jgi:serine/threonine protein kinase
MTEDGERPPDARVIGGRYRLAERLGTGPAGTVWRARDEQGRRQVAVKEPLLPGDPAEDEDSRRLAHRLYREARAATRVRHPSAVRVYDVVTDAGVPWVVMELVEGESLREVLRRGPVPPAEAARVGLAVLGALRTAHAVGIVHRDLKPANVLLERETGRVVVTDFGIGDGRAEQSPTGFAAPERTAGPGAGPASDLWSLGALLRAVLGDTDPGPLGPLLDRLHAQEPEARPPAEHVEAALRAYLGLTGTTEGAPPTPPPLPTPEPTSTPTPTPTSTPMPTPTPEPTSTPTPTPTPTSTPTPTPTSTPSPTPTPTSTPTPAPERRRTPRTALGLPLARKAGAE